MDAYREKLREARALTKQASALITDNADDSGLLPEDVESQVDELIQQAKTLRDEAHRHKRQLERVSQMDDMMADLDEPNGRKTFSDPGGAGNPLGASTNPPTNGQNGPNPRRVEHDLRYGELPKLAVSLIGDLYGSVNEYTEHRVQQAHAFNKYIRRGERFLKQNEYTLLTGEPIMTPEQILFAIKQGVPYKDVKSSLVEASDVLGGFLVPEDFRTEIIRRTVGMTIMRGRARVVPTSRDVVEWPKLAGGNDRYTSAVRVTWVDATPAAGAAKTNPTFGMVKIPVHTVMAETFLGRNLIEDAAVPVADLLQELFSEAVAIDEDEQFLIGDGVGKPQGILPGSANSLSLSEAVTGNATAVTADGVRRAKRSIARQYRGRAVWLMNSATALALELLKDGTGNYFFDLDDDELLRKPMFEDESLPDIGANAYPIIYGDPTGYLIADRIGMTVERFLGSPEARTNQVVYVLRRRLGGQVTEPWKFCVQKVAAS